MGTKTGLAGERSGLFWHVIRLTKAIQPTFVFLENVSRGIGKVEKEISGALKEIGYSARAIEVPAFECGANQERVRWFCLAHRDSEILRFPDRGWRRARRKKATGVFSPAWWATEPGIPGMAHGVPHRVDRHRALGNAVVPLQAREAFMRLVGLK